MEDIELKGVGRGKFRRVGLSGFMELCKAGMNGIEMVGRIGVMGPKVFPVGVAGKRSNIRNQVVVIKLGFQEEGETLREDRGCERLRGEVNNRMGKGEFWGRGLKFEGQGSWYVIECAKTENYYYVHY